MLQNQISAFQKRQEKVQALQVQDSASAAAALSQQRAQKQQQLLEQAAEQQQQQQQQPRQESSGPHGGSFTRDPTKWQEEIDFWAAKREAQRLPLGLKIKKVIDCLFKERRALSCQEIEDLTFVDATSSSDLQNSMRKNPKILCEGERFKYKAKHDLKGREDLLRLIRDHKDGLPMDDVMDSYAQVKANIEDLKAAGQIWALSVNESSEEMILYPNDPKIQIRVDQDIIDTVRAIDLPNNFIDIEKELKKSGQAPSTSAVRQQHERNSSHLRSQQKAKTKRRRESKRTKFTNAHLPELFQDTPPQK